MQFDKAREKYINKIHTYKSQISIHFILKRLHIFTYFNKNKIEYSINYKTHDWEILMI